MNNPKNLHVLTGAKSITPFFPPFNYRPFAYKEVFVLSSLQSWGGASSKDGRTDMWTDSRVGIHANNEITRKKNKSESNHVTQFYQVNLMDKGVCKRISERHLPTEWNMSRLPDFWIVNGILYWRKWIHRWGKSNTM